MKPISTLYNPKQSVDILTKQPVEATIERSDICTVPAAGVIGEAVVALRWHLRLWKSLGGISRGARRNYDAYQDYVKRF